MLRTTVASEVPSESSFQRILEKAGLVKKRRRRTPSQTGRLQDRVKSVRPNQVWTIDFQGWWRTRDYGRFEPLTVRDDFSRFLLCARALKNTRTPAVRDQREQLFTRYGLPELIRSDNGAPFAHANSPFGLTSLSAWWFALGIDLDRIRPGKPQDNGGHERMPRDLLEWERSASSSQSAQQVALEEWRKEFNHKRPHEALGLQVPADVYERSSRLYDPAAVELTDPVGILSRRISENGRVKVAGFSIAVTRALAGCNVGLEFVEDGFYSVWFGRLCLGEIDLENESFQVARE